MRLGRELDSVTQMGLTRRNRAPPRCCVEAIALAYDIPALSSR